MTLLKALQNMDQKSLSRYWFGWNYPFDHADCGMCITMHGHWLGRFMCWLMGYSKEHKHMQEQVRAIMDGCRHGIAPKPHQLEALYALRAYHADLFREPMPESFYAEVPHGVKAASAS